MLWLFIPLAFLLGSIPFGLLLGKVKGIDIREHGSGNIGSTNVFRTLGKKSGIICLILDILKGFFPVFLARHFVPDDTGGHTIEVLTALASILGHNYSPWIGFKGGKGIATSGGALLALMPAAVVILIIIFAIFTFTTKYVSIGSIATGFALQSSQFMGPGITVRSLTEPGTSRSFFSQSSRVRSLFGNTVPISHAYAPEPKIKSDKKRRSPNYEISKSRGRGFRLLGNRTRRFSGQ